jgi:hypothetical protein
LPPALSFIIFFGGVPGVGRDVLAVAGSALISTVVGGGIKTCGDDERIAESTGCVALSVAETEPTFVP